MEVQPNHETFLQLNMYGTSLYERPGSGMTSITSWILSSMQFIRKESNIYGRGSEAHFEHDETQYGCFVS